MLIAGNRLEVHIFRAHVAHKTDAFTANAKQSNETVINAQVASRLLQVYKKGEDVS